MGVRKLHGIATTHQWQDAGIYQELTIDASAALHLSEHVGGIERMAIGNGSIEVRSDFLALHLSVDNPTLQ